MRYLESLDSTRVTWDLDGENDQTPHHLQCFNEILISLILGERVFVPQPYALDSLVFAQVTATVLDARDAVTEKKGTAPLRPFQLNLFRQRSLADAAADALERAHRQDLPFHSSLMPDVLGVSRQRTDAVLANIAADAPNPFAAFFSSDDPRSDAVARIWGEFGARAGPEVVHVVTDPAPVRLQECVARFVDAGHPDHDTVRRALERSGLADHATTQQLRAALSELARALGGGMEVFEARSVLRRHVREGALVHPARDVLGDDQLAEVQELVDTLYNLVIVASYGHPAAMLTTDLLAPGQGMARAIAQIVAIAAHSPRLRVAGAVRDEHAGLPPLFDLLVDAQDPDAVVGGRLAQDAISGLHRHAKAAISAVLALWPEERFGQGCIDIEAAAVAGDTERFDDAVRAHVGYVVDHMVDACRIAVVDGRPGRRLAIGVAVGSAAASTASYLELLTPFQSVALGTLGAAAGLPQVADGSAEWRQFGPLAKRRLAKALGGSVWLPAP